jgi:sugar phosphate isomerase/epimerase
MSIPAFAIDGPFQTDSMAAPIHHDPIMKNIKTLLATVVLILVAAASAARVNAADDLTLGIQTWTLRNLNFDQMVEFAAKHHLKQVQLIPNHLNPNASREEWKAKKAALDHAGLIPYTFGVAGTSLNKEENRRLFEMAKFMGMKLIVVEPNDFRIFDNLEELVKEYDIKIAIHNHGIKSMYGNPMVVKNILKHRDPRIGVCLDTGWITSSRFDAAKVFKEYEGRVYDIHLKDKKVTATETGDVAVDTFIGDGDTKFKNLFKALKEAHFAGVLAIETDNDLKDPTEHVTKAIHYFHDNQP